MSCCADVMRMFNEQWQRAAATAAVAAAAASAAEAVARSRQPTAALAARDKIIGL